MDEEYVLNVSKGINSLEEIAVQRVMDLHHIPKFKRGMIEKIISDHSASLLALYKEVSE